MLTRNQAFVLIGGAAVIIVGRFGLDVIEDEHAMETAAYVAANRINDACDPRDVSRAPVSYTFKLYAKTYARNVHVTIVGQAPVPSDQGFIAHVKAVDSYAGGEYELDVKTRCPSFLQQAHNSTDEPKRFPTAYNVQSLRHSLG